MALGSTQPLTETEYQEFSWGVNGGRRVRLTNLPPLSRLSREYVGASTCHKHIGLCGVLQG
jgi:hypothetical protein